jgi:hypothetical protein
MGGRKGRVSLVEELGWILAHRGAVMHQGGAGSSQLLLEAS